MKKRFVRILAASMIFGFGFVGMVGCGDTNVEEGEVTLESITVTTPPTKVTYQEGEEFDRDGMVVTATYSDDSTDTINNYRLSIEPSGPLTPDVTEVTITYEGASTTQKITVNELVVNSLTITQEPYASSFVVGGEYDFGGLTVYAEIEGDNDSKLLTEDDYTITVDGTEVKTGDAVNLEAKAEPYTATVSFKGKTATFTFKVMNGYVIEGEDILFSDDPGELKSYVRIKMNSQADYLTKPNPNGSIRAVEGTEDAKYASGEAYLGDLKKGNVIDFYFYSEIEQKANVSIVASSGYMIEEEASWVPSEMGDMQLNKAMTATTNGTAVTIADDVILEGGTLDDVGGVNALLWTNWKDVEFGTMDVKEGWNTISIVVTSEYINCKGAECSFNLDYINVDFGAYSL